MGLLVVIRDLFIHLYKNELLLDVEYGFHCKVISVGDLLKNKRAMNSCRVSHFDFTTFLRTES